MRERERRTVAVTRHPGAAEWLARNGYSDIEAVTHLDEAAMASIGEGDRVVGTLPVHLAAEVSGKGAKYVHLTMRVPPELRGRDLTADEMDLCGCVLREYTVFRGDVRYPDSFDPDFI